MQNLGTKAEAALGHALSQARHFLQLIARRALDASAAAFQQWVEEATRTSPGALHTITKPRVIQRTILENQDSKPGEAIEHKRLEWCQRWEAESTPDHQ